MLASDWFEHKLYYKQIITNQLGGIRVIRTVIRKFVYHNLHFLKTAITNIFGLQVSSELLCEFSVDGAEARFYFLPKEQYMQSAIGRGQRR